MVVFILDIHSYFCFGFCGSQHDDIISFRRNILIPLSIITYTFKYLYFSSEKHYALLRIS